MAGERLMHQGDAAASSLHPREAEQNQLRSTSNYDTQVAPVVDYSNHPSSLGTPPNQRLPFAPQLWSAPATPYSFVSFTSFVPYAPPSTMFNPQIAPHFPMGPYYPRFHGVSHNVRARFPETNTHPHLDPLSSQTTYRYFVDTASHLPNVLANNQSNASGLYGQTPSAGGFTYASGNPGGSGSFVPAHPVGGWPSFNTNVGIRGVNCIGSMSGLDSRNLRPAQEHCSFEGNILKPANTIQGTRFDAQRHHNRRREISSLPTTRMASNPGVTISPSVGAFRQEQPGHAMVASNANENVNYSAGLTNTSAQRDVHIAEDPRTTETKGESTHNTASLLGCRKGRTDAGETASGIPQAPLRMHKARKCSTSQLAPNLCQSMTSNASGHLVGSVLTSNRTACQSSVLSKPQLVSPSCLVQTASASRPSFRPNQTAFPQVPTSTASHVQSSAGLHFGPSKCQATTPSLVGTASIPDASLSAQIKPTFPLSSAARPVLVRSKTKTGPVFHIKRKVPLVTPKLSGYSCFLCKRDLSYAEDGSYTQPSPSPHVAVLSCGHSFHALCLQRITPDEEATDPPCIPCAMGEK